jgi:SAM-dependent methyltransferase
LESNSVNTNNYDFNYYSIKRSDYISPNFLRTIRYTSKSIISKLLRLLKPISNYDRIVTGIIQINNPNILDYGSGNSFYINFLRSLGIVKRAIYSFDPYSNDPETFTSINKIPFRNIDLIISNQVFEHLSNPAETLEELYTLSKDKCDLIFSVPVVGGVLSNYKEYSYTLQAPDHVTILSLHTWVKLITNTQWILVSICEDHISQNNYINKSLKLAKQYKKDFIKPIITNCNADNIIFHLRK